MQSAIQAKAASQLLAGNKFPFIVSAICSATCQYILSSAVVNSMNTVIGPGYGTQAGVIVGLVPDSMSSLILLKGQSMGIGGKDFRKLCDAVSFGVVSSMSSVTMQGSVMGGGPGIGTGTISGLIPSALESLIYQQEIFRLIHGVSMRKMISAIAFGICTHIMAASVIITDIGTPAPPPVGPIPVVAPGIGILT